MNDEERQFEEFVRGIKFDDTPDPNHRDKLEQDLLAALARQPQQETIWRTIMESRIMKLATAAVVILAVVLSVTILEKSTKSAWAIEDTIEALKETDCIYISGFMNEKNGSSGEFKQWVRPNKVRTRSGDCRMEDPDGDIWVAIERENTTYEFDRDENTVHVIKGINAVMSGVWPDGDFIQQLRKKAKDWQETYGKDEETKRRCVFITAKSSSSQESWWVQVDLETKLPVRGKQWNNANFKGKPWIYAKEIIFNPEVPEGIFEFEIPDGAKVVYDEE